MQSDTTATPMVRLTPNFIDNTIKPNTNSRKISVAAELTNSQWPWILLKSITGFADSTFYITWQSTKLFGRRVKKFNVVLSH
jgi:hypothetical protein